MIIEIIQLVEVWDDAGDPVVPLCVKHYLSPEKLIMSDLFTPPTSKHHATVRREVRETIGGPGYSSVQVATSIEVICDQDVETIRKTAEAVLGECAILNEEGVLMAYEGLLSHRRTLKLTEE